ncbi:hypothetical protein ACFL2H_08765 [Planctomycetota bacterium]
MSGSNTGEQVSPTEAQLPSHRPRKKIGWYAKRLLLAAFATCLALLVAEITLRLFVEQELRRSAIYDRDLGWRGRPHANGLYIRRQDGIRTHFKYNNLGYRDEDVLARRDGDSDIRVMLLGDSFLENLEVEYEHVFHKRLEDRLNVNAPPHFHAVAIGSQGYSTAQELLAFRRFQETVSPNIVIAVFYTGNDFEDNARPRFAYLDEKDQVVLPPNEESLLRFQFRAMTRWCYESSHLVYLVKNQLQQIASIDLQDASKKTDASSEGDLRKITLALLQQTKQEVEATGARYGLIIVPSRDELLSEELARVDLVADHCEKQQVPFLNLADCLTPDDYFDFDVHFTVDGHAKVAKEIASYVKAEFGEIVAPSPGTDSMAKRDETE